MISDRQSTAGTSVSAALIIFVGLLTAPIGITGFAAIGFKAIGLLLLTMALSDIFLIATGIQMIVGANRLERDMKRLEENKPEHPPQYHPAYQNNGQLITFTDQYVKVNEHIYSKSSQN